jgi:glycyl-tRNA synthetase beta chain
MERVSDFLLELRSEEIPARMQDKAREDLARLFSGELEKAGLEVAQIITYATPRRLTLMAKGLPLETAAVSEETKGPKVGAPPQALEGFLRKTGLTQDRLENRDGVYFAVVAKPGRATSDVLAEAVLAIIRAFPWPKSQRWGAASISTESLRWVRPLQGIVALFGDDVVPFEVDGIVSGSATMGHRFHHSGPITIGSARDYAEKLHACHVIVDQEERRAIVRAGAERCAADAGLVLVPDEGLINENSGLTEWPVPMLGYFDPAFLEVPEEVIQLTARVNQKYFICRDGAGRLANAFVCTANIVANDAGAAIIAGNEKVLAARLSDAKFFWEQDLKVSLEEQAKKLSKIVFHEKLGTVADKVGRVAKLARWLVDADVVRPIEETPQAKVELANNVVDAAMQCKADLVTGMVGEFPELQGIMGGYYARKENLPAAVADAIRDHYKPVGQGDDVPTAPVTVAVSLADKLDTLVGFFSINEKPTGSRDPFALRRAALGILELLNTNLIRMPLWEAIAQSLAGFTQQLHSPRGPDEGHDGHQDRQRPVFDMLSEFFADRLKVQQRDAGVRHDLIDAVFALGGEDDLVRLLARVKALQAFVGTEDGVNLLAGYKRAANILKQAGDFDLHAAASGSLDPLESALLTAVGHAESKAETEIRTEDFEAAMSALASLRVPIDAFFEGVMVNDKDPQKRVFRLGLLARFRDAVHRVADFSRIEG